MSNTSDTMTLNEQLHDACEEGNLSLAKAAVSGGADVNNLDSYGLTPIMVAMWKKQQPVIKWLLSVETLNTNIGQNVHNDNTCLHFACAWSDSDIVREVVRRSEGGRVNQVNTYHYTPVQEAVSRGNVGGVVGMMGDERVDWGVTDKEGRSLLEMARYGWGHWIYI